MFDAAEIRAGLIAGWVVVGDPETGNDREIDVSALVSLCRRSARLVSHPAMGSERIEVGTSYPEAESDHACH
jgi:hypothetical protein